MIRLKNLIFAVTAGLAACALQGQTAARFEVASVRPNRKARCIGPWDFSAAHGMVTAKNAPLLRIVSRAYNLTDDRVSGPAWMDSECYDIKAKAPSGVAEADLMPMLQELLRERFHLVARRESAEKAVYVLMADLGGSKMRGYGDPGNEKPAVMDGKTLFMARHMRDLCERLGKVTGKPVLDQTGLDGDYMIVLSYSDGAEAGFDVFNAVRDQLGLRLEAGRRAVEVLRVESADKVPTGN